jgi:chemotaxis signal transduction protein
MSLTQHKATLVPDPDSETGAVAVLAVLAGDEAYGFPLSVVREILVPPPLTEVPRAPEHFLGVISVRGQIITLIDLPKMLNLEVEQTEPYGRVLLVDNGEELIGVAVGGAVRVRRRGRTGSFAIVERCTRHVDSDRSGVAVGGLK